MATCQDCGHPNREAARFCEACGARLEAPSSTREQRKVVTVLFCDVAGSTQLGEHLDPEALRALLARYFERMRGIVERHGGSVEKFIGDAVMAVFGVPTVHEDDALRAVRAAVEMRDAVPELGVEARIGIATGEVVVGTEERLATGDVVNLAARLEQAAAPGEIMIGAATHRLLRDIVDAEEVGELSVRGKAEPVDAYRVAAVTSEPTRRHGAPMVGRERQLGLLQSAFANAREDRACHLFTVLGSAGVGKSRLVAEFLARIDATIVRGRCLSYGEGVTYWPAVEVVKQLDARPEEERPSAAVAALLHESDSAAMATAHEIAWGVRRTLERAAQEQPLVVVWDDLQWAEEAFLDLVEHVADMSRDAPILVLCMARPELLDRRPGWAGGKLNAITALLEPLTFAETDKLLTALGGADDSVRSRIRTAAGGNPLFVEEMLALARESGDDPVAVPPTIQALLAARLDQLDEPERSVLERGAVEGEVFHRGAVEALTPEKTHVATSLFGLVRKELVRPDRPQLPDEEAFRFRHLLIRDAAYDALPKAVRAELHLRFAAWLDRHGNDLVEFDEIMGYHLEQACRYRSELGQTEDPSLTDAARKRLKSATQRAMGREDYAAAANLAERALALVPAGQVDGPLEVDRNDAIAYSGQMDAHRAVSQASIERARAAGDRGAELAIRIDMEMWNTLMAPEGAINRLEALLDHIFAEVEDLADDFALLLAYLARSLIANWRGQGAEQVAALERAVAHASRLPDRWDMQAMLGFLADAHTFAPTPAAELLGWLVAHGSDNRATFRLARSAALVMLGDVEQAIAIVKAEWAAIQAQGNWADPGLEGQRMSSIAVRARRLELADEILATACRALEAQGERGTFSTCAARRAVVLADLGRLDEAESWARKATDAGGSDDILTHALARRALAKALARRGDHRAEPLAREAVNLVLTTDFLYEQADAYTDLADVLERAGRNADAAQALQSAIKLYDAKGDVTGVEQAQARLDALNPLPPL
jgi:class 3 adenylate cyclase/tetratricopeptide (TPR) repeat protein